MRGLFADAALAAEEKRVGDVVAGVSERFQGEGLDRRGVKQLVAAHVLRGQWVRASIAGPRCALEGDARRRWSTSCSRAPRGGEGAPDLLPGEATAHRFDCALEREEDGWRVVAATWRPIALDAASRVRPCRPRRNLPRTLTGARRRACSARRHGPLHRPHPRQLAAAARAFGLPAPERVKPEPKGSVNTNYHLWAGGERYFLRLNEGKTRRRRRASRRRCSATCSRRASRCRTSSSPTDGRPFVTSAGKQAMLFAYAPGEEIDRADAAPERCRRVGEQLGRLHDLAAGFSAERENPYAPARVARLDRGAPPDGGGDPDVAAALPMLEDELEPRRRGSPPRRAGSSTATSSSTTCSGSATG